MFSKINKWLFKTESQPLEATIGNRKQTTVKLETKAGPTGVRTHQILFGSASSVGIQRNQNEDALFTMSTALVTENTEIVFGLFMVADGMGGHEFGEVASGTAIRSMADYVITQCFSALIGSKEQQQGGSLQEMMSNGALAAHEAVHSQAPGGGTTLTAALMLGAQVTLAHVGDSRAYFIHPDGGIQVLTQDHSLVRRLVEIGQISAEEAKTHPKRSVLYRALGQAEPVQVEVSNHHFPQGGTLLLCSDGLWGVVPEDQILAIVVHNSDLTAVSQELVDAANAAGGPDNISVILVGFGVIGD